MLRLERQHQKQQQQPLDRTRSESHLASCTPQRNQPNRSGGVGPTVIPLGATAAAGAGRPSRSAAAGAAAAVATRSKGRHCGTVAAVAADDEVTSSPEVPFRVCSPGSAKRRRQLLRQQHGSQQQPGKSKGKRGGKGPNASADSGDVMDVDAAGGLDLDSAAAELLQGGHPWAGAWAGGRKGASADVGPLYVPRSWPAVPVTVQAAPVAAPGTGAAAASMALQSEVVTHAGPKQPDGAAGGGEAAAAAGGQEGAAGGTVVSGVNSDGKGKAMDDDRRRASAAAEELRAAYQHFREHCAGFKQYHELKVSLWLEPEQLVGRELRVLWPDEEAWFCGRVTKYVPEQGTHTVEYDDGDVEHLHLAAEEVRLQLVPGEAERGLVPKSSSALRRMADLIEANVSQARKRATELRAGGVAAAAMTAAREGAGNGQQQHAEDPDEVEAKADRWSQRATQLHALVAIMAKEEAEVATAVAAKAAAVAEAGGAAAAVAAPAPVAAAEAATAHEPRAAGVAHVSAADGKGDGRRGSTRCKQRVGQQQQLESQPTQPPEVQLAQDDGDKKRENKGKRGTCKQGLAASQDRKNQGLVRGRSSTKSAPAAPAPADEDSEMPPAAGADLAPVAPTSEAAAADALDAAPVAAGGADTLAEAGPAPGAVGQAAEACEAAAGAEPWSQSNDWATVQVLRPGEVVWAQVRRSAPWPAIVITREEAEREGLGGGSRLSHNHQVFVRFFGDYTVFSLPAVSAGARIPDRGAVVPFLSGLQLGWHTRRDKAVAADKGGAAGGVASSAQAQRFLRALFELRTYMTEGELPRGMIPPNFDEEEDEEEDGVVEVAVAVGGRGGAAARGRGAAGAAALEPLAGAVRLPFTVGHKLRILALGEVVWLSRHFHDEKYIYPLGYKAERMMSSGASGGKEVMHVMEVISEDGVRPLFRITAEGKCPVTADTASKAMRALFEEDARASGRAFARTGVDLYGLSNARVAALVRSLPGAERCERFANWPADMEKPPPPALTPYEEAQRRALYARALRLPEGVVGVHQTKAGMCFECEVCGEDEESSDDLKLECDMCRCVVHMRCYGVATPPPAGVLWLCDVCQMHAAGLPEELSPPCELCPVLGGARKRTENGGYVHLLCALWTPGVTFGNVDTLEPVVGVAKAVQSRASLRCSLCSQPHGACVQCAGDRCYTAFHPMCAREAGMALCELRQGKRDTGAAARSKAAAHAPVDTGAGAAADGGAHALSQDPSENGQGADVDGPYGKENQPQRGNGGKASSSTVETSATAVPAATQGITRPLAAATAAVAGSTAAGRLQRRNRNRARGGRHGSVHTLAGITLGKGVTMACFCLRHEELVLHRPEFCPSYPGGRFAERRAELTREQLRSRRDALLAAEEAATAAAQAVQQQEEQLPAQLQPTRQSAETGRSMSFADWRSRGHRAPEAVAIAREKRSFVRQLPYLVNGRLQHSEDQVRALAPACIGAKPAGCLRPTASVSTGPDGHLEPADSSVQASAELLRPNAGSTASAQPASKQAPASEAVVDGRTAAPAAAEGVPSAAAVQHLPQELLDAAMESGARSVAERYWAMRATVSARLAAGKSAIHGWGAFAKVPHKRGDMLIEYAGELIRPVVSDVREKRMYNDLVGCGTYIFSLNGQQHIDATKAGNMAHLLNHSCDPNCYSRAITLTDPLTGVTTDHVIIIAKRDLQPWEELTYDYRFNSAVELPCNCSAATCRLLVNWPEESRDEDEEGNSEDEGEEHDVGARPGPGLGLGQQASEEARVRGLA
ncbi:hypothetical protein HXX76_002362 [Chlamydomonas incerta]|uniref:Histone-lysine N-methyltransferase n=1 Tax=Chlamydomonas incerta TaxID=51695 RepID=A0A835TNK1_CHLIN|nr:hypothetical protein HXX76_002362 [Chlamydomonas incerta]|eukprot:KAG2442275.1 hypothetical protein HXX76_002362 [Chlamydomonas incerta]